MPIIIIEHLPTQLSMDRPTPTHKPKLPLNTGIYLKILQHILRYFQIIFIILAP